MSEKKNYCSSDHKCSAPKDNSLCRWFVRLEWNTNSTECLKELYGDCLCLCALGARAAEDNCAAGPWTSDPAEIEAVKKSGQRVLAVFSEEDGEVTAAYGCTTQRWWPTFAQSELNDPIRIARLNGGGR